MAGLCEGGNEPPGSLKASKPIDLAQLTINFNRRYALCIQNFITDRTSHPARAGIGTSIFNQCNEATENTRQVPLAHAPCQDIITYTQSLRATYGLLAVRRVGKFCSRVLLDPLALEKVMRDSRINTRGTIFYKLIQVPAYADDLDIIGSQAAMKEAFIKLEKGARKMHLQINEEKTKYLSRAVASWSKASSLGLALRNARWFESSWEKKFSHEISASVWDRCPPSIVMHLGSYDR
ncbi:hypothetical protein ANN_07151 [Periplaneta americana]|uniref:Reverse transcriptase n=1 Tax=Periplaneta americana TaxID=6978 RepID=A0ABQ8TFF3_PERAM|nr:hypothetical protein ANN_07151 [Periplaneta americana]